MSSSVPTSLIQAVEAARLREAAEFARATESQANRVIAGRATGTGDIDESFSLNLGFRLVYVRCHFEGGSGVMPLKISLDSAQGSAYDATLYTAGNAGVGADVNYRVAGPQLDRPSSWTFQPDDAVRITWTNPDPGNMTWGLEVGLAPA
jgi:hypothetical protein